LCNNRFFTLSNLFQGSGYIGFECLRKKGSHNVTLVNIYSPCDLDLKRRLYKEFQSKKVIGSCDTWCMLGDFNCVSEKPLFV